MNTFFLIIEIISYAFAAYLLFNKKDLAIIYLPVLIYSNVLINPTFSAFLHYATISTLILYCISQNTSFYRNNIWALLISVYFLLLLPKSSDLLAIRPNVFSVIWLFTAIPLISELYQKYSNEIIFKEVTNAGVLILCLFFANVLVSTKMGYAPNAMYGITKGILYGNMFGAGFNILSGAVFLTTLRCIQKKNIFLMVVLFLSLVFIMLCLRRTVMLMSALAVGVAFLTLLTQKDAKKFIVFGCFAFVIGYSVYSSTDFMGEFNERYEMRKLDERALDEEKRLIEYELLYDDMFVKDRYSPWFGYELFNSAGNYGGGIFETRTLHSDITSIIHSSGLVGILLYLLMAFTAFRQSFKFAETKTDKLIVFFCAVLFATYTVTGRYTETGSMLMTFLILMLPLAKSEISDIDLDEVKQYQLNTASAVF